MLLQMPNSVYLHMKFIILHLSSTSRKDMRKEVLRYVGKAIPSLHNTKWTEVKDIAIITALSSYEEKMVVSRHKFGVLLCLDGQVHENDMFGND